jgi:predicted MFS family arabinose efflux permease
MDEHLAITAAQTHGSLAFKRSLTIGLIGFLTLVDLFATQAILPSLAVNYGVRPAQIGLAANASTIGMAIAGLLAGVLAGNTDRRTGVCLSLALLAIPTTLLAHAPSLITFAMLRVIQGLFMATAFTLTLTYLGERCSQADAAGALAAYVTGGVASNLVGRLVAATVVAHAGTAVNFFVFAGLNLAGAVLAWIALTGAAPMMAIRSGRHFWSAWTRHLADPRLRCCCAIGFLILFGFIGTFTYVGFVLMRPPLAVSMMGLGLVYICFLPSMITTPAAGPIINRIGTHRALPAALVVALVGLVLLLLPELIAIFAGLVLIGVGTFFAQAAATGFIGYAAHSERAAASGLYLSFYYAGGLVGAAVIGQLFDRWGWNAAVAGIFSSLALGALFGARLILPQQDPAQ